MRTLRPSFLVLIALALGCGRPDARAVVVGDGYPRAPRRATPGRPGATVPGFLDVILDALDSAPPPRVGLEVWSARRSDYPGSEAAQAERFAGNDALVAVVGHAGSKNTLLAAPVYAAAGIPLIVPTSTSRQLRSAGPLVFMLAPPDDVEGAFIVDRALDSLKATRIALIFVADAYGIGIRDGVVGRLAGRRRVIAGEAAMGGHECDELHGLAVRGIVRSLLKRARPDLVVIALASELGACVVRELVAVDPHTSILASDSFDPAAPRLTSLATAERARVRYVTLWEPGTDLLTRDLVARTRRVLGRDPDAGDALSYDAYLLVAAAVRQGHHTRASVGRWLRALGTRDHPPFIGVTGPISFIEPRSTVLRVRALAAERADERVEARSDDRKAP